MRNTPKKERIHLSERRLEDLVSVGPAIRTQLSLLGVESVPELARRDPEVLYRQLCRKTGTRVDPCVLDTYHAAVQQARNPLLPPEQCVWWYWSRKRKAAEPQPQILNSKNRAKNPK